MKFFGIFLLFILAQRTFELALAKKHEGKLKSIGAEEFDHNGYRFIVGMHVAFFFSLIIEKITLNRTFSQWWIILGIIFSLAQILRYWSMSSLGVYWNTKIIISPHHSLLGRGPYRFLRHPNYVAVTTELAVVPLIFSCYITCVVFSILNILVIRRRIRIEIRALTGPPLLKKSRTEFIT